MGVKEIYKNTIDMIRLLYKKNNNSNFKTTPIVQISPLRVIGKYIKG